MRRGRGAAVDAARRLRLEPALRQLQRFTGSRERWRDWRDNRQIELLLRGLEPEATCIDVGACMGDVLASMVRFAPLGSHVAFEPDPDQAHELQRRFSAVNVRSSALWSEPGVLTFNRVRGRPWYSGLNPMGRAPAELECFPVRVERLDDVLREDCSPDLIKIDVEGAEGHVLAGAQSTLERHRPVVVFEHGRHASHFGTQPDEVFNLLSDRPGLRIFDIDGGGPYSARSFVARVRRGDVWTFVARP